MNLRNSLLWCSAMFAAACGAAAEQPEAELGLGNLTAVYPMPVAKGLTSHYLTDYYPQWEGADSLTTTDSRLELHALADDFSRFEAECAAAVMVSTIEVWHGGEALSIVVLGGERHPETFMTSQSCDDGVLRIVADCPVAEAVAMWQNRRIDPADVTVSDDGMTVAVRIPACAADYDRSVVRVYAASDGSRFNDILLPLERGRVVERGERLDRHDFQSQVLYSLMIDRFANGNPDNDMKLSSSEVLDKVDYQGGDIKGITQKIDDGFFDDLGVTTVWISPITQNPYDAWGLNDDPVTKFSGYHGYWPIFNTAVDRRMGTADELREMLSTAHAHGMNVILDYVANHMHIDSPVLQAHPDWTTDLLLPDGRENIGLYDEQRLTTWFDKHIPTLDLEREEICDPMTDSALYWVENFDFDGYRHDACKHIPLGYWRMLAHKMKSRLPDRLLWQIGETYGSVELINSYVKSGMIDAQFDFNLYHTAIDVVARGDRSMRDIARTVEESEAVYGSHHTMGNITGNHDKARFISLAGGGLSFDEDDKAAGWKRDVVIGDERVGHFRLLLLKALIMTVPGVPCIYQGDEFGVPGGNDPDNRRMMQFDGYGDMQQVQLDMTRRLVHLRRSQMSLLYGDLHTLHVDDDVWVFARSYMGQCVVTAINAAADYRCVEVALPHAVSAGAAGVLLSSEGAAMQSAADDRVSVSLPAYGFAIITNNQINL